MSEMVTVEYDSSEIGVVIKGVFVNGEQIPVCGAELTPSEDEDGIPGEMILTLHICNFNLVPFGTNFGGAERDYLLAEYENTLKLLKGVLGPRGETYPRNVTRAYDIIKEVLEKR